MTLSILYGLYYGEKKIFVFFSLKERVRRYDADVEPREVSGHLFNPLGTGCPSNIQPTTGTAQMQAFDPPVRKHSFPLVLTVGMSGRAKKSPHTFVL